MSDAWVLASRNPGKLMELRALFAASGITVIDLGDAGIAVDDVAEEAIEAFDTFEENALAKAWYFASRLPGRTVVADDSGLVVDALGGAPGVRSKRWSGRSDLSGAALDRVNNDQLLAALAPFADRAARFACAAAWCDGGAAHVATGFVEGHILGEPSGTGGFGYDPYMFVSELGMTLADATIGEKQRVSHRGRAFSALLGDLARRGVGPATCPV